MNEREQVKLLMDATGCEEAKAKKLLRALERASITNISKAETTESQLMGCFGLRVIDGKEQQYILHYRESYLVDAIQKDSIEGEYIFRLIQ